jgi:hypothetical protein
VQVVMTCGALAPNRTVRTCEAHHQATRRCIHHVVERTRKRRCPRSMGVTNVRFRHFRESGITLVLDFPISSAFSRMMTSGASIVEVPASLGGAHRQPENRQMSSWPAAESQMSSLQAAPSATKPGDLIRFVYTVVTHGLARPN